MTTEYKKRERKYAPGNLTPGVKLEGRGRPKGAKTKEDKKTLSQDSIAKLAELNFDPIEKLVAQYKRIEERIVAMENGTRRYSAVAIQGLLSTQATIINNLMKYGYRAVPERKEIETTNIEPLKIVLTDNTEE